MGNLLLNTNTVIMCPHGGIVTHIPTSVTSFRVDGRGPMLLTDLYMIAGCPNLAYGTSACGRLIWVNGSVNLHVKGQQVLTLASVGLCQSLSGIMQGPAIISYTQTGQREPETFTDVKD